MATFRFHTRVTAPPDEVWKVLSVIDYIPQWFPGIDHVEFDGEHRILTLRDGRVLKARVVTSDPVLRRYQYQFVEGMPVPIEFHLGTIDIIKDGAGSLIVYSQQIEPEALADEVGSAVARGIDGIARYFGGGQTLFADSR